jgi:hypothetical protein
MIRDSFPAVRKIIPYMAAWKRENSYKEEHETLRQRWGGSMVIPGIPELLILRW